MADTNICLLGDSTAAASVTSGTPSTVPGISGIRDGGTQQGISSAYWVNPVSGTNALNFTATVTFAATASLTSISLTYTKVGSDTSVTTNQVQAYYSGAWNNVMTIPPSNYTTIISTTALTGVTGVRVNFNGVREQALFVIELTAIGTTTNDDIGLRGYDGTDTITFATQEATSTDLLRIYKDGTVYAPILVATTDDNASAFRIYDGSATKSLKKLV